MGLVESWDQKPLLGDKVGLGLFMSLRHMRIHAIMHKDACSLSSCRERGFLDISRARVLLQIEPHGETLTLSHSSLDFSRVFLSVRRRS